MTDEQKEIKRLKEEIDELEFQNLFYKSKLDELEKKRVYYRLNRQEKLEKFLDVWLREEIADSEKDRIKNLFGTHTKEWDTSHPNAQSIVEAPTIHEKYDMVVEEFDKLKKLEHYILTSDPYQFWSEHIGGNETGGALECLIECFKAITDGSYTQTIREEVIEEMMDGDIDIPEEVQTESVRMALEDDEVICKEAYDEVEEEKDELKEELFKVANYLNEMVKSIKTFDDEITLGSVEMGSATIMDYFKDAESFNYEEVSDVAKDIGGELRHILSDAKLKSNAYEGIMEVKNDDEKDIFDMIEVIQTKNENVAKNDVKRVEEIMRLKHKVNRLVDTIRKYELKYVMPYPSVWESLPYGSMKNATRHISLNSEYLSTGLKELCKSMSGGEWRIAPSDTFSFIASSIIKEKVNEMLADKHTLLYTEVWTIIKRYIRDNFCKTPMSEKEKYRVVDKSVMFRHIHGSGAETPYTISVSKALAMVHKNNWEGKNTTEDKPFRILGLSDYPVRKEWDKDESEDTKKDIHNY